MGLRLDGIEGIGGAAIDALRGADNFLDRAQSVIGAAGDGARDVLSGAPDFALGLAEGYASRRGLLLAEGFAAQLRAETTRPGAFLRTAGAPDSRPPDRSYDGFYVGAGARTFPPTTPLSQIPAVQPRGGARSDETLIYVNGISTTKDGQFASLQRIADRTGSPVVGIHNATQGGVADVIQSAGDTIDVGRNPAVDTLADTVYAEIKAGRGVHLLAHSQGALITSRALQDVRNRLRLEDGLSAREADRLLSRVKVETFGGAAGGYPDGPQYVHYVNRRDPVSTWFGLGPFANPFVDPGRGAVVHRFSERHNSHGFDETYLPRRVPFEQARRGDFD